MVEHAVSFERCDVDASLQKNATLRDSSLLEPPVKITSFGYCGSEPSREQAFTDSTL
jgi:hypothetical protein